MGSFAADSISVIEETFLFIDLVRRIEKTAAASVEDIIAHINSEIIKGHPDAKLKIIEEISAVIITPAVARSIAGLATGLKLWLFVLNPPAKSMNIKATFAALLVNTASSKYINPVTSLPKIIPIARAIIIRGIFTLLDTLAINTIKRSIKDIISKIGCSILTCCK
jgi:hypothetical protein